MSNTRLIIKWPQIIEDLELKGLAKVALLCCVHVHADNNELHLLYENDRKALFTNRICERIADAFSSYYGFQVFCHFCMVENLPKNGLH